MRRPGTVIRNTNHRPTHNGPSIKPVSFASGAIPNARPNSNACLNEGRSANRTSASNVSVQAAANGRSCVTIAAFARTVGQHAQSSTLTSAARSPYHDRVHRTTARPVNDKNGMIISRPSRNQNRPRSPLAFQNASPIPPTSRRESTSPGSAPPHANGIAAHNRTGGGLITSSSKRPDFHIRSPIGRCQYSSCVGVHRRAQSAAKSTCTTRQPTTNGQNPRKTGDLPQLPPTNPGGDGAGSVVAPESGAGLGMRSLKRKTALQRQVGRPKKLQ